MSIRSLAGFAAVVLALTSSQAFAQSTAARPGKAADTAGAPKPLVVNKVVAVVNGETILRSEVMEKVFAMLAQNAAPDSLQVDTLMRVALKNLTDDELLVQKAKTEKVEIADGDVKIKADENLKEIRGKFGNDAEMLKVLKESGYASIEDFRKSREDLFRRQMLQRDLIAKVKRDGKIPTVNVTDAEVTADFELSKASLGKRPATVVMRQIVFPLLPTEAAKARGRAKADSLRTELEAHPQDFETTAKRESMDPGSKELGGDLGWYRRGVATPAFERALFALNPGVISPVVETPFGYHIIRVDRVQPAEVKSHHILIKFALDSNDEKRSQKLADSVVKVWRAGANYDSLAAHFNDDANEESRSIPEMARDSLPISYQKAIEGHKQGDIIGPFPIADGTLKLNKSVILQLMKIEEAGDYTITQLRQRIREDLVQRRSMARYIDTLRNASYVWIDPDLALKTPAKRAKNAIVP